MPEVTIKYRKAATLKILKDLAKYLDFSFSTPPKVANINGVTILPGNPDIDTAQLENIFSELDLDAKKLRAYPAAH